MRDSSRRAINEPANLDLALSGFEKPGNLVPQFRFDRSSSWHNGPDYTACTHRIMALLVHAGDWISNVLDTRRRIVQRPENGRKVCVRRIGQHTQGMRWTDT